MNKDELTRAVAKRSGQPILAVKLMIDEVFPVIEEEVAAGGSVQVIGFGKFERRFRQGRNVRDPQTGEQKRTTDHYVPAFRPGKEFKDLVEKPKKKARRK